MRRYRIFAVTMGLVFGVIALVSGCAPESKCFLSRPYVEVGTGKVSCVGLH